MFSKIIVAHDHRDGGQDALALARVLARPTDTDIVLVGVIPVGMMPADIELIWRDEEHEFARKIRAAAEDSDGEARVFHSHSVAKGLTDLSEEIGADLIVVGSSRRGKVGQVVGGNVARQVLHGASCAVAVAPVGYADQSHDGLDSIVAGVDGMEDSQAAARAAADLAAAFDADATLVSVLEPPPIVYGKGGGGLGGINELKASQREQLQRSLDRAAGAFSDQPETELVEGDPVDALSAAAADASLLVVGSRGYGPLGRVLLGATDSKLLDSAPTPMLVWPRRAEASRTAETANQGAS